ncbi:MAG: hypothetical protein Q9170_005547, partial [Blastenia crenularia]
MSVAPSDISSPDMFPRQREQSFPLMQLPLEIRRLIYWEILQFTLPHIEEDRVNLASSIHRANFFATSKQTYFEATSVWYNRHFFTATVGDFLSFEGEKGRPGMLTRLPAYLPKIHNLEIRIPDFGIVARGVGNKYRGNALRARNMAGFCHEIAAQCRGLREVRVKVLCLCCPDPTGESSINNLPVKMFERLLKPLERVRARNIQFEAACENRVNSLDPIFSRLAGVVRSLDPIPELEGNEKIWWDIKERAAPFSIGDSKLKGLLHEILWEADIHLMMEVFKMLDRIDERQWQNQFATRVGQCEERIQVLRTRRGGNLLILKLDVTAILHALNTPSSSHPHTILAILAIIAILTLFLIPIYALYRSYASIQLQEEDLELGPIIQAPSLDVYLEDDHSQYTHYLENVPDLFEIGSLSEDGYDRDDDNAS